jgi:hypothetical protein
MDHIVERGRRLLLEAESSYRELQQEIQENRDDLETADKMRAVLGRLRSAMDWLEDTPDFEAAHMLLDQAGRLTRQTFGCSLYQDGQRYEQRCPVALAHTRLGLSPTLVIRESECSICHQDPDECHHVKGHRYDDQLCLRIIKRADVLGVSLVSRPANPGARIISVGVLDTELQESLGAEWHPGMPVSCDLCLYPCDGVREVKLF